MMNAFATHRTRYYDSRTGNKNRPFRRGEKRSNQPFQERASSFCHEVDMSRVRPLTNEELSRRLIGESRFAAWMGIYGIAIGVLLGWFVANIHLPSRSVAPATTPAPMVQPMASPTEDAADDEIAEPAADLPQVDQNLI